MDSAGIEPQGLAIFLLNYGQDGKQGLAELTVAVRSAFEKLSVRMSKRLGASGYRALLTRSVSLAAINYPWLGSIQIGNDGTLEGFDEAAGSQSLSEAVDGSVAILTQLISLLDTFVGRGLSVRLLSDTWTKAVRADQTGTKENSNG